MDGIDLPGFEGGITLAYFTADSWELYHVAVDFSHAHDLAARYPRKLRELQALFDVQAKRNNVYPLGAGTLIRGMPEAEGQRKFVYYGGFPTMYRFPGAAIADVGQGWDFSKILRIAAEVEMPTADASGVILAGEGAMEASCYM